MTENVYAERARSIKAFRLSRVMSLLLDQDPLLTLERIAGADEDVRHRAARVAGVRDPSAETWSLMVEMLATNARYARRDETTRAASSRGKAS